MTINLRSQIKKLESELKSLRKQVEGDGEFLDLLTEPKSYAQLATGDTDDSELIHRLHALEKSGVIERWDLPRWIRADLPEKDKARLAFSETPLRQRDLEVLIARREGRGRDPDLDRPPASTQVTALQEEGLVRLGDKKGDPWYLPPPAAGLARGTQYLQHRSRRGRQSEAPPTPRARPPRGG